ncbi:MAG: SDR family oxidoreductase [Solirubrobacterales bacterium]|nr:SDR family oxidoreductase [Solirubrobacterales bacterium]
MRRFSDRSVLVTGATEGIGRAIAFRLAEEGANLTLVARTQSSGDDLVALIGQEKAVFVAGDVRDPELADRAVATAEERFGRLDALVNNAAMDHTALILDTPVEDVRELFDVNFFGTLNFMQAAGRAMKGRGGSIVNLSSRLASIGVPTMALYSATKGAIEAFTRGAAIEWAADGIRVNAVAPGLTATPLAERWIESQDEPVSFRRALEDTIPQGRLGTPEDVAAAVAYLASDESGHVTGASIPVDGGYTAA